ncbi:hypothetical protein AVEN_243912-1, partial [Araneus ventricosus]
FSQERFMKYVPPPPTVFSIPRETSANRIVVFTVSALRCDKLFQSILNLLLGKQEEFCVSTFICNYSVRSNKLGTKAAKTDARISDHVCTSENTASHIDRGK